MRFLLAVLGISMLFACGCKNVQKDAHIPSGAMQSELDSVATRKLEVLTNNYYELKNAFVASDAMGADSAAALIFSATTDLEAYLEADSVNDHKDLQSFLDTLKTHSKRIIEIEDESCEMKRVPFEPISEAMYGLLKKTGVKNTVIYRQYCPMAFNDKGAYWLSNEMEIENPYFGKKMLECGEVVDSLK